MLRDGTMMKEIRLPARHPLLRPRLEGDTRRPGHPGTAVRLGEDLYEVVTVERSGAEWIYRLEPWTGRDTIRVYVEWGEGAEREFAAGLRDDRMRERKNLQAWAAQAFLGFLPARRQEKRCQAAGLDPARATLWSALLETAVALPFAFLFFIEMVAGGASGSARSVPAWAGVLAFAVMAEGAFRLAAVLSTGEPIGSLFLALLDLRTRSEGPQYVPGDEIMEIGEELMIRAQVPKVWWERAGGVMYSGEPFILAGSSREKTKYVYRFRKGGAGFPILDPELEKTRNRSSDLSYAFAPLWGFLPAEDQKALEFYGRYNPRPYVMMSIGINVLIALAIVGPGLRNAARGLFEIRSLVPLVAAGLLFTESLLRIVWLAKDGRASGSLLGAFVRPLYDHFIKDRPARRA